MKLLAYRNELLLTILLLFCWLHSDAVGQATYSESSGYKPLPIALIQNDLWKKPDKNGKDATQPPANSEGDITVKIPLAVMDRSGSFTGGLTKADVNVFVDDVEVPLVAFEQDKQPMNVVLVVDSSPSVRDLFKGIKTQASKLVAALPPDVKVMIVDLNEEVKVRSRLTTNREDTQAAISRIRMGDGTALYAGLEALYQKVLFEVAGPKVIILMTDGVNTTSEESTYATSLSEVEKNDATIYPVRFDTFMAWAKRKTPSGPMSVINADLAKLFALPRGSTIAEHQIGLMYLLDLATISGGRVFSSDTVDDATRSMLAEWASRYYITITLPRKTSESRRLRVRVNRPSVTVLARGSFVER